MQPRARQLIDDLRLQPHPEGGYFREIHRSLARVRTDDGRAERAAVTSIYFLLVAGQHSRWHRVRSDELWHFYEGDALDLLLAPPDITIVDEVSVSPLGGPGKPIQVAPADWWQAARSRGDYSLVGCTVAPGFEYADFAFLRDDPKRLALLAAILPEYAALA
jgi:predicted cupin superfamily sugar epimerase